MLEDVGILVFKKKKLSTSFWAHLLQQAEAGSLSPGLGCGDKEPDVIYV